MIIHFILFAKLVTIKSLFGLQSICQCDMVAVAPGAALSQAMNQYFLS